MCCGGRRFTSLLEQQGIAHVLHLFTDTDNAPASAVADVLFKVASEVKASLLVVAAHNKVKHHVWDLHLSLCEPGWMGGGRHRKLTCWRRRRGRPLEHGVRSANSARLLLAGARACTCARAQAYGWNELLLGSVADYCVQHSTTPLMVRA